jgi:hypothetical protein
VHLGSNFVGGTRKYAIICNENLRLRQKNKLKLKTAKRSRPNPQKLTWKVIKSNSINVYYLPTTGFLYGGKSGCTIDMKKDKYEGPTVPYGPCQLLTFLADIYEQHFQTRLVNWICKMCRVC